VWWCRCRQRLLCLLQQSKPHDLETYHSQQVTRCACAHSSYNGNSRVRSCAIHRTHFVRTTVKTPLRWSLRWYGQRSWSAYATCIHGPDILDGIRCCFPGAVLGCPVSWEMSALLSWDPSLARSHAVWASPAHSSFAIDSSIMLGWTWWRCRVCACGEGVRWRDASVRRHPAPAFPATVVCLCVLRRHGVLRRACNHRYCLTLLGYRAASGCW
jgi:hypothetical protein